MYGDAREYAVANRRFLGTLGHLSRVLPWTPGDASTEEGRAQERYRRAFLTTAANVISKVLSMILVIVSVPLTLSYLGNERFGIWMTISSLAALLAFLDFGIGNGLLNRVAQSAADTRRERLPQVVTNGLLLLSAVGVFVGAALSGVSYLIPWSSLIKVSDPELVSEIRASASTFAVVFGLSLPFLGLQRVFLGLQEGFLVHVATSIASIVSLGLLLAITSREGAIPQLILATIGVQAVAPIVLFPLLLRRRLLVPLSFLQFRNDGRALLRTGGVFFVLQLGAMVAWGSDSLIVSSMLGASQVAVLAVTFRLFQFVTQPLAMVTNPLWSGYADAAARKDTRYIRQTLKTSIVLSFSVAMIGAVVVLVFHRWLIAHWTSNNVEVPILLAVGFAAWSVLDATGNAFAMFLNGLGILRPQLIVVSLFCMVAIPLKIYLVGHIGLVGIIFASLISYLLAVALPYLTFLRPAWTIRLRT